MSNFCGLVCFDTKATELLEQFKQFYLKKQHRVDTIFFASLPNNQDTSIMDFTFDYFPNTFLKLGFEGFEEYLQTLKAKKRWDLKNKHKIFLANHASLKMVSNEDMSDYQQLFKLSRNTETKNIGQSPEYLSYSDDNPFQYFSELGNHYDWLIAEKENQVLGFVLLVKDSGNTLLFKSVGLDYKYAKDMSVYFNLYYGAIDFAIQQHYSGMFCGTTTYAVKQRLGCKLIPRTAGLIFMSDSVSGDVKKTHLHEAMVVNNK
ncbi:peptidogalycan biosysnthesis protein [Lactiplantibacillus pentosus]|nr:peptidogalycan biosysnthesis protein [Lactiplantibacillus pentosus]